MMKRLSALLCVAALFLTSCAGGGLSGSNSVSSGTEPAKGRYLEEELALPGEVQTVYDLRVNEDGILEMFAYIDGYTCAVYRSADFGTTWEKGSAPWLEPLLEKGSISNAYYTKDGGLLAVTYGGEGEPDGYRAGADGTVIPIEEVPVDASGSGINGLMEADNGDFLFSTYFSVIQTDADYKPKTTYEIDGLVTAGSYSVSGETLAVCEKDAIRLYDIKDGSLKTEIPQEKLSRNSSRIKFSGDLGKPARILTFDKSGESFYYCDASGIYRRLADGSVSERLVSGELSSLSMPSVSPQRMILGSDGTLLVCAYANDRYTMLRYRYDADVPAEPSTELNLYMLSDNKTIRQAVGMFQRQNPDVKVNCEVGAESADAAADALRSLNTRLLAGDGPDVLVLDGMPADSYIEKGVLLDLSGTMGDTVKTLLPNIAGSFKRNESLYALPARFSVPMMGLPAGAEGVKNLDNLAAWLEGQPNARLGCTVPESIIRLLYPVLSPGWFREDGSLDEEAFSRSLTLLKQLSEIPGWANADYLEQLAKGKRETVSDLEFEAVALAGKGLSADLGSLYKFRAAAAVDGAIKELGGGTLIPISGERGPVFVPSAVLGVNAAGKQQELAQRFVQFALSAEVLRHELEDGLPANREALEINAANPYTEEELENSTGTYYSTSQPAADGEWEVYELNVLWPSEAFMDALVQTLESIQTASPDDTMIRDMMLNETESFFSGSKTAEQTADAFARKIGIYLAEQ